MKYLYQLLALAMVLVFLLMVSLHTHDTYALWSNAVLGNQDDSNAVVSIGTWTPGPASPDGISYYDETTSYAELDIVWFEGDIWIYRGYATLDNAPSTANKWTIYNDLDWYSTVTYREDDLVYYNDNIYRSKWEQTNHDPATSGINGPWEKQITDTLSWRPDRLPI